MTKRQQLFIDSYLTHFNATKAALDAGYSEKGARNQGHILLTNTDIKKEIDNALTEMFEQTKQQRYLVIKFWFQVVSNPNESTRDQLKASELIAKYLKMFVDQVEHSGSVEYTLPPSVVELLHEIDYDEEQDEDDQA